MLRSLAIAALLAASVPAAAKNLKINSADSEVGFRAVGKPGFLRINGEGAKVEGQATYDAGKLAGTFETTLASFVTGIDLRDEHMKEKYLEVGKFPKATLKWTAAAPSLTEEQEVPFTGTLTLHGVEKEVKGTAKLEPGSGGKVDVEASFPIKLSEFKIDIPSYMGVTVAEDVEVKAKLSAQPE